ncbi:hypothetical protein SUGI_0096910 [Cryptomeria japonica]|nr:hypothetical protein SUGI_0096910 [Cryptomeria japonica]
MGIILKWKGGSIGSHKLKIWLKSIWGLDFDLNKLPYNFFLINLPSANTREEILKQGNQLLEGHSILMNKWIPNFNPWKFEFSKKPIWIRLYELPTEYWDKEILKDIAKGLGEIHEITGIVSNDNWGDYARFCIRVSPFDQILGEIELQSNWGNGPKKIVKKNHLPLKPMLGSREIHTIEPCRFGRDSGN